MKIIFCDTTLSKEEIQPYLNLDDIVLPAIKRGDLIKLLNNQPIPEEIIIVDGVFDQTSSITHKEILYAIANNVKIIGISSMGALRGAELFRFGMIGAGEIFQFYLNGEVQSDEEVAVSYVKRKGYIHKTIPLINIRKTVEFFKLDDEIFKKSKQIFYKQRSWEKLEKVLTNVEFEQLKNKYIDQKKLDVINYLKTGTQFRESSSRKKLIQFHSKYINEEIIHFTSNGILNFIRKQISEKYFPNLDDSTQYDDLTSHLIRFLGINEKHNSVIKQYLKRYEGVDIHRIRISQFNRNIIKELGIHDKDGLKAFLNSRLIDIKYLDDIFINLYKLYLILMNEYYSQIL